MHPLCIIPNEPHASTKTGRTAHYVPDIPDWCVLAGLLLEVPKQTSRLYCSLVGSHEINSLLYSWPFLLHLVEVLTLHALIHNCVIKAPQTDVLHTHTHTDTLNQVELGDPSTLWL
jgi:hypothetical protein